MGTIWLITSKDLRQRFRDRSAWLFMLVLPIGLVFLFDLVFAGLTEGDIGTIRVGVVVESDDHLGRAFVEEILPAAATQLDLEITEFDMVEQGRRAAESGDVDAVIVVPAGFGGAVQSGQAGTLTVIENADAGMRASVVAAIADSFADRLTGTQVAVIAAAQSGLEGPELAELADQAAQVISPLELTVATASDEQLDWSNYLAAGMAVFFLFFTVQFGVTSYLEEKQAGTMARLLSTPVRRWQILAAKGLTSFVVGLVATSVLLAVAVPLFGADWGDPLGVALVVLAAVAAATSIVGVVAGIARTAEQAGNYQSIIAIVLGMLGGAFFPVATGPGLLSQLSLLTPHAWFLRGLGSLSAGASVAEILPAVGAMLAFAAVVGAAGLLVARRTAHR